jgi:hypothetical protein
MRAVLAVIALALVACDPMTFVCAEDSECVGPGGVAGTCEATRRCSFPDDACPSGARYGDLGGDLAGACTEPAASWWDDAWAWRRRLSITAGAALPVGFTIAARVPSSALADGGGAASLRAVVDDGDAWIDLPRVIDPLPGGDALVWIRLPAAIAAGATDASLYLYGGNPSPATPPREDPHDLFDAYLPFDAVDEPFDTYGEPAPALDGGEAHIYPGTQLWTVDDHAGPAAVDLSLRVAAWDAGVEVGWHDRNLGPPLEELWIGWRSVGGGAVAPHWAHTPDGAAFDGTAVVVDEGPHVWTVEWVGGRARFLHDGELDEERDLGEVVTTRMDARVADDGATTVYLDWMRIRGAVDPPPVVDVGDEEPRP